MRKGNSGNGSENKRTGGFIMKFAEWFLKKLTVGRFPSLQWIKEHSYYDIFINVSDEPYPPELSIDPPKVDVSIPLQQHEVIDNYQRARVRYHWFPMNEKKKDVGLNSIYAACVILYYCELKNKSVYLHCHSGVNRSPTVQQAYYYMRKGEHLESKREGYVNELLASCSRGYLPPKAEMEKFLNALMLALKKGESMGGQLCKIKKETINNF